MHQRGRQQLLARRISDEHIVPSPTPNQRRRNYFPSVTTSFSQDNSTAPRPRATVADAHRQALNRDYVLLPLRGTSPPPGRAGLLSALARANSLGPLPTAVEATTG